MSKVYIAVTEVVEFAIFTSNVASVCSTEQKACERMRDEDDGSEVFKTFEDY